jgi:hypothetical protein
MIAHERPPCSTWFLGSTVVEVRAVARGATSSTQHFLQSGLVCARGCAPTRVSSDLRGEQEHQHD